jgi:hypothetical protein
MLTHVSNYDPGFDEVNYTGPLGHPPRLHVGQGGEQHPRAEYRNRPPWAPRGADRRHRLALIHAAQRRSRTQRSATTGDPGPTNFDTTVSALAGELTAVYRGAGGAEADIQRYISSSIPMRHRRRRKARSATSSGCSSRVWTLLTTSTGRAWERLPSSSSFSIRSAAHRSASWRLRRGGRA